MENNNEYSTIPLVNIINEMALLEQDINLKLIKYEKLRTEVCKRFPILEEREDVFKPKELVIKENKKWD